MDQTKIFIIQNQDREILGVFNSFHNATFSLDVSWQKIGLVEITEQPAEKNWSVNCPDGSKCTISEEWLQHRSTHL